MDVKNCRGCGRLFNYIGGGYFLCPACMEALDKKLQVVKKYIQDNPKATMTEISQDNDVSINQIERWIREERLTFADDSPIGIECEGCGAMIKSGRYCQACKDKLQKTLSDAYKTDRTEPVRKNLRDGNRMRYLDQ